MAKQSSSASASAEPEYHPEQYFRDGSNYDERDPYQLDFQPIGPLTHFLQVAFSRVPHSDLDRAVRYAINRAWQYELEHCWSWLEELEDVAETVPDAYLSQQFHDLIEVFKRTGKAQKGVGGALFGNRKQMYQDALEGLQDQWKRYHGWTQNAIHDGLKKVVLSSHSISDYDGNRLRSRPDHLYALPDSEPFLGFESPKSGTTYLMVPVNGIVHCTCPKTQQAFNKSQNRMTSPLCKHMLALLRAAYRGDNQFTELRDQLHASKTRFCHWKIEKHFDHDFPILDDQLVRKQFNPNQGQGP